MSCDMQSEGLLPRRYWQVRELVVIGIFAAVIKVSSIFVTLAGGGMSPLALVMKNLVFTALLVVLLYKVRKTGTLSLFLLVSALISLLLLGGNMVLVGASLLAGLLAEAVILLLGGYRRALNLLIGVAVYDILSKLTSLGFSWLMIREQPQLMMMVVFFVAIGYLGSLAGLFSGHYFVKELRHAGIVRQ